MSNFESEHPGVLQAILSVLQMAVAGQDMVCRYITVSTDFGTLPWLPDTRCPACMLS